MAEYIDREAVASKAIYLHGFGKNKYVPLRAINEAPAADVAPVVHGRCRYCSPGDGPGVQWDFEDIEVSVTFRGGVLTICNQYGDEAEMPIRCCPICGADMRGE